MKRKRFFGAALIIVLIWVLNASCPGTQVVGCFHRCAQTNLDPVSQVVVISFNMLHEYPSFEHLSQRLDLIANEITHQEADIVLLQEVPWTLKTRNAARALAEQTGMNFAYLRANGNRWAIGFEEGEAILSKYPILETSYVELKPKAGFFEHRIALKAALDTPLGVVTVVVTHLTNGDPAINRQQAQDISEFAQISSLAILAGDFNAEPQTPQIQALKSHWVDAFDLKPENTCCVDDLTARGKEAHKRIDYIFLSPRLVGSGKIDSQLVFNHPYPFESGLLWASNHYGLKVSIQTGGTIATIRYKLWVEKSVKTALPSSWEPY